MELRRVLPAVLVAKDYVPGPIDPRRESFLTLFEAPFY